MHPPFRLPVHEPSGYPVGRGGKDDNSRDRIKRGQIVTMQFQIEIDYFHRGEAGNRAIECRMRVLDLHFSFDRIRKIFVGKRHCGATMHFRYELQPREFSFRSYIQRSFPRIGGSRTGGDLYGYIGFRPGIPEHDRSAIQYEAADSWQLRFLFFPFFQIPVFFTIFAFFQDNFRSRRRYLRQHDISLQQVPQADPKCDLVNSQHWLLRSPSRISERHALRADKRIQRQPDIEVACNNEIPAGFLADLPLNIGLCHIPVEQCCKYGNKRKDCPEDQQHFPGSPGADIHQVSFMIMSRGSIMSFT